MRHVVERAELILAVLHRGEKRQRLAEQLARPVVFAALLEQDAEIERGQAPYVRHPGGSRDGDRSSERLLSPRRGAPRTVPRSPMLIEASRLTTHVADRLIELERRCVKRVRSRRCLRDDGAFPSRFRRPPSSAWSPSVSAISTHSCSHRSPRGADRQGDRVSARPS